MIALTKLVSNPYLPRHCWTQKQLTTKGTIRNHLTIVNSFLYKPECVDGVGQYT